MKNISIVLITVFFILFVACSGTKGTEQVSGIVYAPNGVDPIVNAVVYIPADSKATGLLQTEESALTTSSSTCQDPGVSVVTKTCTGADGSFVLADVPKGEVAIIIAKGFFKKLIIVNVEGGVVTKLTAAQTTLPSTSGTGASVPRIAVVTGNYDNMEEVLAKLGLGEVDSNGNLKSGTEKFTLLDGNNSLDSTHTNFDVVLNDVNELKKYDLIFIDCGNSYEYKLTDSSVISRLKQYVTDGGRIYVTDLSYDFIEQVFPEFIDFYNGSGTTPETMDDAEVGTSGITTNAEILDTGLKDWLNSYVKCGNSTVTTNTLACLNTDGTVHVEDFLAGWAVIEGAHSEQQANVKSWIRGNVSWSGGSGVRPLTITFPYGKGKLLYSSYHTAGSAHPQMFPQERILQYLIFEMVE